ncbi:hypothetical protein [Fredinandcohnia onubensis]|uniref:hypothetical protein n=1 Tax=Fredinandcohnia onubensis TaxID=1571209 RepID=UPI000C0BEDE3|nr:hypothetical protein [Fredinandcohnia onubensis]
MRTKVSCLLLLAIVLILVISGCSNKSEVKNDEKKEEKAVDKKEEISIEELLNEANIAVKPYPNYFGRDSWSIEQVNKTEISITNAIKNLPLGGLIVDVWYGLDDLAILSEAIKEGTYLGIRMTPEETLSKLLKDNKKYADFMKYIADGMEKGETIENLILDPLYLVSADEEKSYRTIKIMSYAFMKNEYEEIPYGVWSGFINGTKIPISVEIENDELIFYGRKTNKNTLYARTYSTFQFTKGQIPRAFGNINGPDLANEEFEGMGIITDRVRELAYDIYLVLDDKEPVYYPEYAKTLVSSYEETEKTMLKNFGRAIEELAKGTQTSTSQNVKDSLLKIHWGMSFNEVKSIFPNFKEEKDQWGGINLSQEVNFYSTTPCIKGDILNLYFKNNKLENIFHTFNVNQECNIDDFDNIELVKDGFEELYQLVIQDYDPTNNTSTEDLGTSKSWGNTNTSFDLGFWVALDIDPPTPYGHINISKVKDGAPVVMAEKPKEKVVQSSSEWIGDYRLKNEEGNRRLEIINQETGTIDFILNVNSGQRAGLLEGTAKFTEGKHAVYPTDSNGCEIDFTLENDGIKVEASEGCDGYKGADTPWSGFYPK